MGRASLALAALAAAAPALAAGQEPLAGRPPSPPPAHGGTAPPHARDPGELRYPIGTLRLPDFLAPGDPLTLSDLRFTWGDAEGSSSLFTRVRVLGLGYLAAEVAGQGHGLFLQAHRLSLSAVSDGEQWTLAGAVRAPRVVLSADARSRQGRRAREWLWGPTLQLRLGDDYELYGFVEANSERPRARAITTWGLGGLYQRAAWLEAGLEYERAYRITAASDENRVDTARATLVVQGSRAELTGFGLYEDTRGRFSRREGEAYLRLRVPIIPRLLLEGDASSRFDAASSSLRQGWSASATWFARRFTLPRAGERARRELLLARAANAAGEYELRVFDEASLRAQRERLSLSPHAAELLPLMEDVYRAQLDERDVEQLGFGLRWLDDAFTGERTLAARVVLGVPWPLAWPWAVAEPAVRFLTLELERDRVDAAGHRADRDRATLTVSLDRELDLVARYARREPTAREIVQGIGPDRRFTLGVVYERGR